MSSPPPLKSCLKPESRTNSLGRNLKLRSSSPATASKHNVNFKQEEVEEVVRSRRADNHDEYEWMEVKVRRGKKVSSLLGNN